MVFKKDHWYWVRYKFGSTLTVARPNTIREGKVTHWSLPWHGRMERAEELTVISEIPFPEES